MPFIELPQDNGRTRIINSDHIIMIQKRVNGTGDNAFIYLTMADIDDVLLIEYDSMDEFESQYAELKRLLSVKSLTNSGPRVTSL